MPDRITNKDIRILDKLLFDTENLPNILHLRAAEVGYKFNDEDKALLLDTYSKLDDILKEIAAFINIRFPGCQRHIEAWNEIDFDTKVGALKISTTDREHIKREWKKGMFDLKSLIKVLRNEAIILLDDRDDNSYDKPKDISSSHLIEYYTDKKNIPNQELVNDTIFYFKTGEGSDTFTPLEFLNLLDKQYEFTKLNYDKGELVVQHLKDLPLSDRKKHTLYGFILKWFGGYPVNNMDEEFDKTLKLVQKEFLAFESETPEKKFCRANQAMRNKFEKYGIAFTTAINNNVDVNEILAAMDIDESEQKVFQNFSDLFTEAVNCGLVKNLNERKAFLIRQSIYNYEFNVWLQACKDWEYRNEEQYQEFLTIDVFSEFLTYNGHKNPEVPIKVTPIGIISKKTNTKLTLRQIALICHYSDQVVTRQTAKIIAEEYGHASGDALFNRYTYYRTKANRIGMEDSKKKNANKIQLFESVASLLNNNESFKVKIMADIAVLKIAILDAI
ncbi:hypothetical protein [Pedobacter sp. UYP1]|uniref:hypothetical protein n=1 Tax=Pedobacter sp. UYP1 TaxID=1756396 RepID=UPI003395531F